MRREELSLPTFSGITKESIRNSLLGYQASDEAEVKLQRFLFEGLPRVIKRALGDKIGKAEWASHGKRCVQFMEARAALDFFLRSNSIPQAYQALILAGPDPELACIPWALSGLPTRFLICDKDKDLISQAKKNIKSIDKLISKNINYLWWDRGENPVHSVTIVNEDCFNIQPPEDGYIVLDLDFCNNMIRTSGGTRKISSFVSDAGATKGPFIFRTTLHVGRIGNSWNDVLDNIEEMDNEIRKKGFRVREKIESKYTSTLPMVSIMWILERNPRSKSIVVL
jgi:hypothetical protein